MNEIEIYYFTGTGNSLYITTELLHRLPGAKMIPIISLLKDKRIEVFAETVILVSPLHGMTLPVPMTNFLKKAIFHNAKYFSSIITRSGTNCYAFKQINKDLKKQNYQLNSQFIINMINNDPKFEDFTVPTVEEFKNMEIAIKPKLDLISDIIINHQQFKETDTEVKYKTGFLFDRLILLAMKFARIKGLKNYFYTDVNCQGCGICEKVCLSDKIKVIDHKPVWNDNIRCNVCYACVNYCPKKAIQIKSKWFMKSYTTKTNRYPHPYATYNDISKQKQ